MGDLRLGLEPDPLIRELEQAGFKDARILPARDRLLVRRDRAFDIFLATARRAPARRRANQAKTRTKTTK